ncbi:serine/threonine protein kinase [[Emmonsia] crescens]|uniref:non-specific serine/threonine protein kinase n=1 Tax=[Emmonsia] crescens TaxID=73230 RepID=A0A2B7Z7I6_9EURO|nr:serine/threonine protein kinase [Emmonsia crescens]
MPPPKRHRFTLFSLVPQNKRAEEVVADPLNQQFTSTLDDGTVVLDIGFHVRSKSCNTLATLGRGDTDIFMSGSSISKIQCSFEIDTDTNVIMFYDRSHSQTTQVFGDNAMPFEYGRVRKVVVLEGFNTLIGMGGVARNLVIFELKWYLNSAGTIKTVQDWQNASLSCVENPRLARTIDESDTILPSRRETRPHTSTQGQLKMRYAILKRIGSGSFGTVHRVVDVDSGSYMAVKILNQPVDGSEQELKNWRESVNYSLKREVEAISKINHPHIIDYIASQGWGEPKVEIFMGLKEGSLESLCLSGTTFNAETLFSHMLQALDHLAFRKIIHRDVKPENILYVTRPDGHQFQLGDFGVCNSTVSAKTRIGTPIYMAPEVASGGQQTPKADVWSLFVTMVWTLDCQGFREKSENFVSSADIYSMVTSVAATDEKLSGIRKMAVCEPENRASAAEMLIEYFLGDGLSTSVNTAPRLGELDLSRDDNKKEERRGLSNSPKPPDKYRVRKTAKPPARR